MALFRTIGVKAWLFVRRRKKKEKTMETLQDTDALAFCQQSFTYLSGGEKIA